MTPNLAQELIALLEPLAVSHGLQLVTVEVAGAARHRTVRVYLDREGGIDIDAIAAANAWISEALDTVSRLPGPYTLEVSSPGIERPLRTLGDFARYVGSRATVRTSRAFAGMTSFTGTITGVENDVVGFEREGASIHVPLADIERARIKTDFSGKGGNER